MNSGEPAATAKYSALVRGPSAVFPRGTVWALCLGCLAGSLALVLLVKEPLSINLLSLVCLWSSAVAMPVLFGRAKYRAFAADGGGIWLGKNTSCPVRLEWQQVRQLTISSYPHGSVLQILLSPDACPAGLGQRIANLALMFVPFGVRRARPELLTVLPDPPRYRVPLAQVSPEQLRSALSALAPVAIDMRL